MRTMFNHAIIVNTSRRRSNSNRLLNLLILILLRKGTQFPIIVSVFSIAFQFWGFCWWFFRFLFVVKLSIDWIEIGDFDQGFDVNVFCRLQKELMALMVCLPWINEEWNIVFFLFRVIYWGWFHCKIINSKCVPNS